MEIHELYKYYCENYKIETDTRKDLNNCIYFALKGVNFNGNIFAEQALKSGASYAVVDEEKYKTDDRILLVDDVLKTLQDLALYHREQMGIPIISLTGSNGKTTTKELVSVVLNQKFNCVSTKGNLNNHIGVPLTLLSMKPDTEIGVVEMGANHPGEIEFLCNIAKPDYGYITNFGKVHLEGFGDLEGVIEAKTELYRYLKAHHKKVFINMSDPVQVERSEGMDRITFGGEDADFRTSFLKADPFVSVKAGQVEIHSKLIGKYNYLNIATAVTIGEYFDIPLKKIKRAIERYVPENNRSQIIKKESNKIISDAYNANPNSMTVALENLDQLADTSKTAILGDMFEIGKDALKEHQVIADLAGRLDIDKVLLIGETFSQVKIQNKKIKLFKDFAGLKDYLKDHHLKNSTILIKASRGMKMERVIDLL
ncbi:MAG: UDP-N-acetylmuramoyl-tripeptide--D-alanyl-D-alanine ligase [Flavobacteriia bacterium]|nr:MAG: UDP-N-acetylmuramoyl-tripeptide--D-alanyl-D-alanine ligase [Flavobacteriia bacterium]